jgi:hypothetical protein
MSFFKKLKTCQRFVLGDDALKPTETLKRLDAIREKVKAKVIVEQAQRDEKPPKKLLERQILSETLRYEQERLVVLKERGRLQHERLQRCNDAFFNFLKCHSCHSRFFHF